MGLFSISSTHSSSDSHLNWYAISLKYLPIKFNSTYKSNMKLQLSTLAVLGSFVALAQGVCLKTSGNAHIIPETGDMQIFAVLFNNGELVCSINRATYDKQIWFDCHDEHYAALSDDLTVVLYAHSKVDYKIPIKPETAGADAWAWNGQLGC
ncbi:hypothetical protein VE02_06387 [Pseudogymnoascus sp. 03VT05]|nr:hypothetical protein VE02_06387 [Pseudogymnoascus sp. 03VT05]